MCFILLLIIISTGWMGLRFPIEVTQGQLDFKNPGLLRGGRPRRSSGHPGQPAGRRGRGNRLIGFFICFSRGNHKDCLGLCARASISAGRVARTLHAFFPVSDDSLQGRVFD